MSDGVTAVEVDAHEPGSAALLRATDVRKSFGASEVLHGVTVTLEPGERHALVGENGAGKSTFVKIIAGLVEPDAGVVEVDGERVHPGVRAARDLGIRIVQQELSLVPTMSIAENAVLGEYPRRAGFVQRQKLRRRGEQLVELVGLKRPPSALVEKLPFAERQLVEIGRALLANARILLLDEPTSALSPAEVDRLLALLRDLSGTAVVYVTHRLGEVSAFCDRATVLRDGDVVGTHDLKTTSVDALVRQMVGREVDLLARRVPLTGSALGGVVLEGKHLAGPGVHDASIAVRAGEVCGIGGFVGAGRTELLRLLAGLARPTGGTIHVEQRPVRFRSRFDAVRRGIAYVPEDRHAEGLALALPCRDNAVAPSLRELAVLGLSEPRRADRWARAILRNSDVRPPDPALAARQLSGGNQQKLVVGRWTPLSPRVFLLDEPTRGVDVGARSEVHRVIDELARSGAAVVVVSSDLPELLTLADRIIVMREGTTVGELSYGQCTEESVIRLATGHVHADRGASAGAP